MHKLTKEELPAIAPLFEGVQETMVWSCLQGLMGEEMCIRDRTRSDWYGHNWP